MNTIQELTLAELEQIGGGSAKDVADFFAGVWEGVCAEAHHLAELAVG